MSCIYIHAIKKVLPIKIEELLPYAQIRPKRIFQYIRQLKAIQGLVSFKKDLNVYAAKYANLIATDHDLYKQIKNRAIKIISDYKLKSSSTNIAAGVTYLAVICHMRVSIKEYAKKVRVTPITMYKKVKQILTSIPFKPLEIKNFKYLDPILIPI